MKTWDGVSAHEANQRLECVKANRGQARPLVQGYWGKGPLCHHQLKWHCSQTEQAPSETQGYEWLASRGWWEAAGSKGLIHPASPRQVSEVPYPVPPDIICRDNVTLLPLHHLRFWNTTVSSCSCLSSHSSQVQAVTWWVIFQRPSSNDFHVVIPILVGRGFITLSTTNTQFSHAETPFQVSPFPMHTFVGTKAHSYTCMHIHILARIQ